MDSDPKSREDVEAEVWGAISAFEQILEAIPNDRVALETLFDAYEQIGDHTRALEYLKRLGQVIEEERDLEAVHEIVAKLKRYQDADARVREQVERLERLLVQDRIASDYGQSLTAATGRKSIDITSELALAWNLVQANELTDEEYSSVAQDLSENSSKNARVPVTVLHVLHDRGFKSHERIFRHLIKDSGMPYISLSSFETELSTFTRLPMEFMAHRGAMVFELMGQSDALVAVLNPYDKDLQADVSRACGRTCHFFLTTAAEYDSVLERMRTALKNAQDKGGG